jgi:ferredoxin--NADP+ reductase
MPHVVTQSCCSDASCVYVCPVNCIHPTPDEPDFLTAEMLYIDPATCVDCGACVAACPVDAIKADTRLADNERDFLSVNSDFYQAPRERPLLAPVVPPLRVRAHSDALRVAVVGSGPAAMYVADEILTIPGAQVNVFERLPVPHGLARFGVSPDHRRTRQVADQFDSIAEQEGFQFFLGVEVGEHLSHDDLLAHHHAVVYAVGASSDRELDVPGADLSGTASATEFVAWYNGHPDSANRTFDLSHKHAVVIGNGNVALDVARILTVEPDLLADTDIAPAALEALRHSKIEEVIIVGRRGPEQSAFTLPELIGLRSTPGTELVLDPAAVDDLDWPADAKSDLLRDLPRAATDPTRRRIRLRYLLSPRRITGHNQVDGVEFARNELTPAPDGTVGLKPTGELTHLRAGLVLTSIGYRAKPVPGLPFDNTTRTVPNKAGRVADEHTNTAVRGTYVAGWIKRGPTGFIGTNKSCAQETVRALVEDWDADVLTPPRHAPVALSELVQARCA